MLVLRKALAIWGKRFRFGRSKPMRACEVEIKSLVFTLITVAVFSNVAAANERMLVENNLLIYDLSVTSGLPDSDRMILSDDHVLLAELLMEHPAVDTVVVSGDGGFNWPAYEMARKIESFGLNTVARHICASACTTVLLGGIERSMQADASLGFHRMSNDASDLRDTYDRLREKRGWQDEFDFASDVFERGEVAARNYIEFLLNRGVTVEFALRALTYSSTDMWYPTEEELLASGVLTRKAKTPEEEAATP
jgi:hypothetical protein